MDRTTLRSRAANDDARRVCSRSNLLRGAAVAILAMGLSACASTTPAAAPTPAEERAELNFDLSKCEPMGANMYKCPAVDKPICSPDYTPTSLECVRIGKKGSVYIQRMQQD